MSEAFWYPDLSRISVRNQPPVPGSGCGRFFLVAPEMRYNLTDTDWPGSTPEEMNMMKMMSRYFVFVLMALCTSTVVAHGMDVPIDEDICTRWSDPYMVHFSAYQPQHEEKAQYCEDVPQTGDTIVVVDLVSKSLRSVPVALRIVENGGADEDKVLIDVPPRAYTSGVIETHVAFPEPGIYTAVVAAIEKSAISPPIYSERGVGTASLSQGTIFMFLLLGLVVFMVVRAVRKSRRPLGST